MAQMAIVDNKTNRVVNIVLWEGAEWLPPRDHLVIACDAQIGDIYDPETQKFSKPKE